MKYSVSSYSFNQLVKTGEMTLLDCVRKAHEMGFDAVEFIDIKGDTQEERLDMAKSLRAEADRLGIDICAYTIGASLYYDEEEKSDAEVERLCRQVDVAVALGASVMRHDVCHSLGKSGNSRSFDLMLPTIAKNARKVAEYAAARGVRTCSENHGFIAQDSDRVERLFCAVAHNNYGILVDIGNFLCVDENPAVAVSRLAPYAVHVHAKDFVSCESGGILTRGANRIAGTTIGEGIVPVKQCLAILKRAGYDGYLTVEYEGAAPCLDGIAKGLANLKRFVSEI